MCPRRDDESSFIINFYEPPDLPTIPFLIHPDVTEDITAQSTIMVWVGDEEELRARLFQAGKSDVLQHRMLWFSSS
jgi:hypothetical protein